MAGLIDVPRIPLSPAARRVLDADGGHLPGILGGGDDYEVLMTAPLGALPALASAARAVGIPLTEIGVITGVDSGGAVCFRNAAGAPITIDRAGWTHS